MIINMHNVSVSLRYTNTTEDTVAAALKGGTDLNCGKFYQTNGQVYAVNIMSDYKVAFTILLRMLTTKRR